MFSLFLFRTFILTRLKQESPPKKKTTRRKNTDEISDVPKKKTTLRKNTDEISEVPKKKVKKSKDNNDEDEADGCTLAKPSTSKTIKTLKKPANNVPSYWDAHQLLSDLANIDYHTSKNIAKLFAEENTIPFICRYRKELIGDITPEKYVQ